MTVLMVSGLPARLRKLCSPSSASPTDITLLEAADQLNAAAALLRRWRRREVDKTADRDPDHTLFGETGWFCSIVEGEVP